MTTITTDPMPQSRERKSLEDGTLLPALLQAVRDQGVAPADARFAFPLAVPMVAARLEMSTRSILFVTDSGELLYGPEGLTIAEVCEQEAIEWDERDVPAEDQTARLIAPIGTRGDLAVHGRPAFVEVTYIGLRDSAWSSRPADHTFEALDGERFAVESDAVARVVFVPAAG